MRHGIPPWRVQPARFLVPGFDRAERDGAHVGETPVCSYLVKLSGRMVGPTSLTLPSSIRARKRRPLCQVNARLLHEPARFDRPSTLLLVCSPGRRMAEGQWSCTSRHDAEGRRPGIGREMLGAKRRERNLVWPVSVYLYVQRVLGSIDLIDPTLFLLRCSRLYQRCRLRHAHARMST